MPLPNTVKLVEVSPRDGLQNEPNIIATKIKVEFINALSQTGLSVIETTSFVSPKWVPQLADHAEVVNSIKRHDSIQYPVLVPNLQGLKNALQAGVTDIAVFTAASETFSMKNTNCTIKQGLQRIHDITQNAKNLTIRGYISCVAVCPYEGDIAPNQVLPIAQALIDMGCYEVSLGDTIGAATPHHINQLLDKIIPHIAVDKLALHCHDTYGQALANIYAGLLRGVQTIDCSVAGLGGCPYAPGAGGNVATEDVLYLLNGLGIKTGVDLHRLIKASQIILNTINQPTRSKVAQAKSSNG